MPKFVIKKCPKGSILRKAYKRKDYISKSGEIKKGKIVPSKCIKRKVNTKNSKKVNSKKVKSVNKNTKNSKKVKSVNKKTKNSKKGKLVIPMKKGELTKHGYHKVVELSIKNRRNALNSAIKEYGASKILKKLGVIRTYHKNKNPKYSKIYSDNMKWTRKKYNNEFKGSWEKSALFKK